MVRFAAYVAQARTIRERLPPTLVTLKDPVSFWEQAPAARLRPAPLGPHHSHLQTSAGAQAYRLRAGARHPAKLATFNTRRCIRATSPCCSKALLWRAAASLALHQRCLLPLVWTAETVQALWLERAACRAARQATRGTTPRCSALKLAATRAPLLHASRWHVHCHWLCKTRLT